MNANSRWQEVIAENMAAGSIPGYKKQDLSFSAVQSGLMAPGTGGPGQAFTLTRATPTINFRPGELQATGGTTDAAIEGPGFFTVQMSNGTTAYTRDGEFHLNSQGQLITKEGFLVLGTGGPISVNPNEHSPINISASGDITQGTESRGRLKIVDFPKPQLLTPLGSGYFVAEGPNVVPTDVAQPSVRQGFLEGSNASSITAMGSLLTAMRGFEANQKVIQLQDDRMGKAISDLGNPS
jgi:flagellar basal-body rod protein FlgG